MNTKLNIKPFLKTIVFISLIPLCYYIILHSLEILYYVFCTILQHINAFINSMLNFNLFSFSQPPTIKNFYHIISSYLTLIILISPISKKIFIKINFHIVKKISIKYLNMLYFMFFLVTLYNISFFQNDIVLRYWYLRDLRDLLPYISLSLFFVIEYSIIMYNRFNFFKISTITSIILITHYFIPLFKQLDLGDISEFNYLNIFYDSAVTNDFGKILTLGFLSLFFSILGVIFLKNHSFNFNKNDMKFLGLYITTTILLIFSYDIYHNETTYLKQKINLEKTYKRMQWNEKKEYSIEQIQLIKQCIKDKLILNSSRCQLKVLEHKEKHLRQLDTLQLHKDKELDKLKEKHFKASNG